MYNNAFTTINHSAFSGLLLISRISVSVSVSVCLSVSLSICLSLSQNHFSDRCEQILSHYEGHYCILIIIRV